MMRRWLAILLTIVGCSSPPDAVSSEEARGALIPESSTGNTILYVSNQSYAHSPVNIRVLLDGKPIIDSEFEVGNQHDYVKYQFAALHGQAE
jgi:hypothetical protein